MCSFPILVSSLVKYLFKSLSIFLSRHLSFVQRSNVEDICPNLPYDWWKDIGNSGPVFMGILVVTSQEDRPIPTIGQWNVQSKWESSPGASHSFDIGDSSSYWNANKKEKGEAWESNDPLVFLLTTAICSWKWGQPVPMSPLAGWRANLL